MSRLVLVLFVVLAIIALVFWTFCRPATLPIYLVATPTVTPASVTALAGRLLPAGTMAPGGTLTETADRFVLRSGTSRFEVYKVSGGVWFEDSTQLWNPDLTPTLPDSSSLVPSLGQISPRGPSVVMALSNDSAFTRFELGPLRHTFVSTLDAAGGPRTTVDLDWHVPLGATVAEPRFGSRRFPVTGGGGEYEFHVGDHGKIIGLSGVWREIRGIARHERLIGRDVADQEYRRRIHTTGALIFKAPRLAYDCAPAMVRQDSLIPVYAYSGSEIVNGDTIPLRVQLIPATRLDGSGTGTPPPPLRSTTSPPLPPAGSTTPEGPEENGTGPSSKDWREVGASWLGTIAGVAHAEKNVNGFLETMRDDGWVVNFDWGNADAWYGDWSSDRAQWVDAADLVFYTGHATLDGWQLFDPLRGTSTQPSYRHLTGGEASATTGPTGGMYGAQDLEWIVVAACGPLEDGALSPGGGDALTRWKGAFGGLHLLLGYGSASLDSELEGGLFAQYAVAGQPLVDAWFRAAQETQPGEIDKDPPYGPTVYVGAMWALKTGKPSPRSDHLWLHGSVAPDPRNPDRWRITWSPI